MNIDYENLEKLTIIIEDLSASLRTKVMDVSYTPQEFADTHQLIRRLNTATKWSLSYFDYFEQYREQNPEVMFVEMLNIDKQASLESAEEGDSIESLMTPEFQKELDQ
jgi:hypothetical protein